MKETNEKSDLPIFSGEIALIIAVIINSCGVALMLHSGAGISAISSVPFAFSEIFPQLTLGTWTYIFQGVLVFSLMVLRKKFISVKSDDPKKKVCTILFIQLYCRLCFWRNA